MPVVMNPSGPIKAVYVDMASYRWAVGEVVREGSPCYVVGQGGVTEIVFTSERGPIGNYQVLLVLAGKHILVTVPAFMCRIEYEHDEAES